MTDPTEAPAPAREAPALAPPAPVSFGQAVRWWFELGCISFGGPAGQIAVMHRELVERRRWISERRFLHALDYCMVLPGPEAQQLATYIGWLMHGTAGGLVAGGLFVLPSLALLVALSWGYLVWGAVPLVAGILAGVKPAVAAIVLAAAWRIGKRTLRNGALVAIAAAAFVALSVFGAPFPLVVGGAALVGVVGGRVAPRLFHAGGGHGPVGDGGAPALIDDDTPTPPHARFSPRRLAALVGVALAMWGTALAGLVSTWGAEGTLPRMGAFFTKAALLTFGGAYAVLPYVVQGGVERYGWLTAPQMMDGLALGETTPGPLIMVVAFVGFLGGWQAGAAPLGPAAAGVAGAAVATFFTFLPSFLFILGGGPLVERTRGVVHLTAPLTAITAAVVGVILDLGLVFGRHTLWPDGRFDVVALAVACVAFAVLARGKLGVVAVVAACGAIGGLRTLIP